jgi:putative membrane protein
VFLFPFGLVFNITGILIDRYPWTSAVFICLIALITALSELRARPLRMVAGEAIVLASALWAVEKTGITTGFPFGEYTYTGTLGWRILGVPAAIVCAWYATVVNAWRIGRGVARRAGTDSPVAVAAIAAVLTLALDLVLEPMAAYIRQYWIWREGAVPLQNYLGWMVFTFLAVLVLQRRDSTYGSDHKELVYASLLVLTLQWILFVATGVSGGFVVPALVSLVLFVPLLRFSVGSS